MRRSLGLLLLVLGCNRRVAIELPSLDERARSALVLVTTTDGTELHAMSVEAIRRGDAPLDAFGPGRESVLLLPYACTLDELQLEPGRQTEAPPGAVRPLPIGLGGHALDIGADGENRWRSATEAELGRAGEIRLDVGYLGCPELDVGPPNPLDGTETSYGFSGLPFGDHRWLILSGSGRYFRFDGQTSGGTATLLATGPPVVGAYAGERGTYLYTKDGDLLVGSIDECLPGEGCFRTAGQGPRADQAWLVDGPNGSIFALLNNATEDATILLEVEDDVVTELRRWPLGFNATNGYSLFLGGIARDGEDILVNDASSNSVVIASPSGITLDPLPTFGSVPTTIAHPKGYGPLVGTDLGTVHARRDGWSPIPKRDAGFVMTEILNLDQGLLFVGQYSMDQYHPGLGACGLADGALVFAYRVVKQGDDYLVLSRPEARISAFLLHRVNPMPSCLSASQ